MPCFTLIGFATWGSEVNSVLREWRGKFFPLYFHSELVSYHWLFSSLRPLEGCPLAFWSCIKEEMGGKSIIDFTFCLTQTLRTEKHIRSQVLAVGQLRLLCVSQRETGEKLKSGRKWGGTPDNTNTSLPRVMCLVLLLPSFLLSFLSSLAE